MNLGIEPPCSSGENHDPQRKKTEESVYRAHRDPTAPVGNQIEVTADGESIDHRYDLLSSSPSGFEWGYGGSGPAQLAIAILAHAYVDEFAASVYQKFKREVVSDLPENGWILTKSKLDAWREGVISNA